MAKMNPYLNFDGTAEAAFNFYKSVFGGEFQMVARMSEAPGTENISDEEKNRLMHISLPINNDTILMASDTMPSMGHQLNEGNNVRISLAPASREEAEKLFNGLSDGGKIEMPLQDTFWGAYYGSFQDKFGIYWMVNYDERANNN